MASVSAIATWLTESNGISASWVAINCGCGIDDARESLEKYLEENKAEENLYAKFVLSGKKKRDEIEGEGKNEEEIDSHLFMVVDSKDVAQAKSQFQDDACFSQLYSLHNSASASTNDRLALASLQQTADYLGSMTRTEAYVENMTLKPFDLEVKPVGKRIKASVANYTIEDMKGPSYVKSGKSSGNKSKSVLSSKGTTVSNFFAMSDKTNEVKTRDESGSSSSGNKNPHSDKKTKDEEVDDEEQEFDMEYKTNKKNLEKRGKKDTSADTDNVDQDESLALTKEDEKLIAKQTGIGIKYGAMDNFVNDEADKSSSGPGRLKRKKKVLTERVTVDEKGYMVTEKVTEEVTDDEPSPKKPSPVKSISSFKPPVKSVDSAAAKKPQQKGLMSFFGKK